MQRLAIAASLAALALGAVPAAARADVFTLYAHASGGLATGKGIEGDRKDEAFHRGARGPTYGARVGVEIVFLDLWVEHDQFLEGGEVDGTWTQFMTGVDVLVGIGGAKGASRNDVGELEGGYSAGYVELGTGAGVAFGTGQQVDPPLDNSELTDKGVVVEARASAGVRLSPSWSLGLTVPLQAAYMIKSGAGATVDDLGTHYSEVSGAALVTLRLDLVLK